MLVPHCSAKRTTEAVPVPQFGTDVLDPKTG